MADGGKGIEAWRFGFGLSPAHKFDPTDADLVAHYLLPRAVGCPNPYAHAVVDADPCSCPPWEFLRRHGHGDSDHAFFFGAPRQADPKKRAVRAVAAGEDGLGGVWDGQKSEVFLLVLTRGGGGGGELAIKFKRHYLSYYHGVQRKRTSGWVMYDYQIVDPPHLSGIVLHRVKITENNKKKQAKGKQQAAAGAGAGELTVPPPAPDQPGPSNYYGGENDGNMGETGAYYAGEGDCFVAGDNYSFENGGAMGEIGGFSAADGISYLDQGSGGYFWEHGSEYYFNDGDNSIPKAAMEVKKQRSNGR